MNSTFFITNLYFQVENSCGKSKIFDYYKIFVSIQ